MAKSNSSRVVMAALGLLAAPLLAGSTGLTTNLDARLLGAHNRERQQAGIPALTWNSELASSAQAWADHLSRNQLFEHAPAAERDDGEQGENLWAGTRGYYSAEAMVDLWVSEKSNFKAGAFPDNSRTGNVADVGHYTQLMWRRTGQVGCAVARGSEEDVLVCRYSQAGNVHGERPF